MRGIGDRERDEETTSPGAATIVQNSGRAARFARRRFQRAAACSPFIESANCSMESVAAINFTRSPIPSTGMGLGSPCAVKTAAAAARGPPTGAVADRASWASACWRASSLAAARSFPKLLRDPLPAVLPSGRTASLLRFFPYSFRCVLTSAWLG